MHEVSDNCMNDELSEWCEVSYVGARQAWIALCPGTKLDQASALSAVSAS